MAISSVATTIEIHVDQRVELSAVLCRMAGFEEYQNRGIPAYDRAVGEHFGAFSNHAAVRVTRKLRRSIGLGYNAPVGMALVASPLDWRPRVALDPMPVWMDQRWTPASAREYLEALGQFAVDTRAGEFFARRADVYREVEARLGEAILTRLDLDWFTRQFGVTNRSRFIIVAGLLHGNQNYGPSVRLPDGAEEVYAVVGTPAFAETSPVRYATNQMLPLIVHEFMHTYANPWVEAHATTLDPPAEKLYEAVAREMKQIAYGNPRVMLYESLVRANTQCYFRDHGDRAVEQDCLRSDRAKQFFWVGELADAVCASESTPRMAAAGGRIQTIFDAWGRESRRKVSAAREQLAAEETARLAQGPQITRRVPANGDQRVNPRLVELELHFDRPMSTDITIRGRAPRSTGPPAWDESRLVLRVPVELESGQAYDMILNHAADPATGFRSADGESLAWQHWRFRTK